MDDRTAATTATVSAAQQAAYRGGDKLRTRYPDHRLSAPIAPAITSRASPSNTRDGGAGTDAGIRATGRRSTRSSWCRATA